MELMESDVLNYNFVSVLLFLILIYSHNDYEKFSMRNSIQCLLPKNASNRGIMNTKLVRTEKNKYYYQLGHAFQSPSNPLIGKSYYKSRFNPRYEKY